MKKLEICRFGVQVLFSCVMIGLCTFKLIHEQSNENQAVYWGGLSGVIAYWLPAPGQARDDGQRVTVDTMGIAASNSNGSQSNQLGTLSNGVATSVTTEPKDS